MERQESLPLSALGVLGCNTFPWRGGVHCLCRMQARKSNTSHFTCCVATPDAPKTVTTAVSSVRSCRVLRVSRHSSAKKPGGKWSQSWCTLRLWGLLFLKLRAVIESARAGGPLPGALAAKSPSRGLAQCADTIDRDFTVAPPGTTTSRSPPIHAPPSRFGSAGRAHRASRGAETLGDL